MHLQESGEMYLETILILSQRQRYVRSVDVADYMHFSKPSVSRAVSLLGMLGSLSLSMILANVSKTIEPSSGMSNARDRKQSATNSLSASTKR